MFETLTLTTLLLIGFFFWQNQRLGLTSAVPKDPNNRVSFYCSECLTRLKSLLHNATIQEVKPDTLRFTPAESDIVHQLTMQEGNLMLAQGQAAPTLVTFLGAEGRVDFDKSSDSALIVTIQAKTAEASHQVALRLEVSYT